MIEKVGIVSYGCGNLKSVSNALEACGCKFQIVEKASQLKDINKLILPGVGAFDYAMNLLLNSGLAPALKEWICDENNKLLGICLGMQLLCRSSEESLENHIGLALIDADVKKLISDIEVRLPNIGWSEVFFSRKEWKQHDGDYFFMHSYGVYCDNKDHSLAWSKYGNTKFSSAVTNGRNVFGLQFHPEKSHRKGLSLLFDFIQL